MPIGSVGTDLRFALHNYFVYPHLYICVIPKNWSKFEKKLKKVHRRNLGRCGRIHSAYHCNEAMKIISFDQMKKHKTKHLKYLRRTLNVNDHPASQKGWVDRKERDRMFNQIDHFLGVK